jgi:hypothetical protein
MSWQAYVDDQLVGTQMVNKACIIGLNGGMWAQSAGFTVRRARRHCARLQCGRRFPSRPVDRDGESREEA